MLIKGGRTEIVGSSSIGCRASAKALFPFISRAIDSVYIYIKSGGD